jgi:hypothetical protein
MAWRVESVWLKVLVHSGQLDDGSHVEDGCQWDANHQKVSFIASGMVPQRGSSGIVEEDTGSCEPLLDVDRGSTP